jgi:hypothetical protein
MNILIAGGRDFTNLELMKDVINNWHTNNPINQDEIVIISGMAKGADSLGLILAHEYGLKVEKYFANWNAHGKSAGYKRNVEMGEVTDMAFLFWDGLSKGTKHMLDILDEKSIPYILTMY